MTWEVPDASALDAFVESLDLGPVERDDALPLVRTRVANARSVSAPRASARRSPRRARTSTKSGADPDGGRAIGGAS